VFSTAQPPRVRPLILVVDDEARVRQVVRKYLEQADFRVIEAEDGAKALAVLTQHTPDLLVLDVMLPGLDGFALTERLRERERAADDTRYRPSLPIILLTARSEEIDRVLGFDLGVDDYVVKPFSPRELIGRINAVLRRSLPAMDKNAREIRFGDCALNPVTRTLTRQGQPIALTKTEFDLLYLLASHAEQVFTYEHILKTLWQDYANLDTHVVTACIYRLRAKIEQDKDHPAFLHTVWGVGYVFRGD
jgi:DNA-binding response OmpR family regulator